MTRSALYSPVSDLAEVSCEMLVHRPIHDCPSLRTDSACQRHSRVCPVQMTLPDLPDRMTSKPCSNSV